MELEKKLKIREKTIKCEYLFLHRYTMGIDIESGLQDSCHQCKEKDRNLFMHDIQMKTLMMEFVEYLLLSMVELLMSMIKRNKHK